MVLAVLFKMEMEHELGFPFSSLFEGTYFQTLKTSMKIRCTFLQKWLAVPKNGLL